MMFPIARLATAAIFTLLVLDAQGAESEFDAKTHHDTQCMKCHDTSVYTRDNRRVTSFAALQTQVARCDANLGTALFPEDLEQLTKHLNDSFYKFKK